MSASNSEVLCNDLCAVFEQVGASAQQQAAEKLPAGATSSEHYLVQACPGSAALLSFGSCLTVQTSPPTYTDFYNQRYQTDSRPESKPEDHLPLEFGMV